MIGVVGAGAFGTSLAIVLASQGHKIRLFGRNQDQVLEMEKQRENTRYLPGFAFPDGLEPVSDYSALANAEAVLLATPAQTLRSVLSEYAPDCPVLLCAKGLEENTRFLQSQIASEFLDHENIAVLSGPSFAIDIANGRPTALSLAAKPELSKQLQNLISAPNLRPYSNTDLIGVQFGGALKNIYAIACGLAHGMGLGDSTKAALMTRGFAEMSRMASVLGARSETLAGLSGFGDLTLTCTSEQSRNYRYGQSLGQASKFDASVTVEGVATSHAVLEKAAALNLDMPITAAVVALVDGKLRVEDAMDMLLSRPLKEE